jgi:hypothetical protein
MLSDEPHQGSADICESNRRNATDWSQFKHGPASVSLSLVKRVPDLAIGLPGLLAWYLLQIPRPLPIRSAAMVDGLHDLRSEAVPPTDTSTTGNG